ncbi:MAG TPA: tRNA preQ1(34) S-adenosylmethionine ribosyltransferase-isomerase QueA [Acidimicrobiales bacterium]|nr:tRNA preQ1(34) S-adenosylmethionine ribosyltransferase-isomerase QueA [Acidimicrobiales bacterium]
MQTPRYELPEEAIAQVPAHPRDSARLLVALGERPEHKHVRDLPGLVGPGDVIVVNNSRVVPARLRLAKQTGGEAEVLLLEAVPGRPGHWEAMVRPGRRLAPGTVLYSGPKAVLRIGERVGDGRRYVESLVDDINAFGELALPPYINRRLDDPERYQTVYASEPGSVAAPTAGLHLTEQVLGACVERGATVAAVDLAVGLGTFQPIKGERSEDHTMHSERFTVPEQTWELCQTARRVIAIGTTTVRALESAAAIGQLAGRTELYLQPGSEFKVVDVLMTNFHQPGSTLLVLLEAFAGPGWRDLYKLALAQGYRFLSFGDAMIVARSGLASS